MDASRGRAIAEGQRAPLQAALSDGMLRRLNLSPALEQAYHDRRNEIALNNIRANWPLAAGAIAVLGALTFLSGLAEGEIFGLVVFGYVTVLVMLGLVVLASVRSDWQSRIDLFVAFAALVALVGMHTATVVAPPGSVLRSMAEYGVIFVTLAIYTISFLSFRQALAVVFIALGIFLLACLASNLWAGAPGPYTPDWARFAYFAGGAALIGSLMGVSQEMRNRTVFLQERLLTLEKQELDQLTGELTLISRQDALTGLANRRHFNEMVAREWSACQREGTTMNLLFIDVDFFKRYNDHYGHQAGDECLQRVAAVLAQQAKRGADLVARYGGEEFVAFFPRTNGAGLQAIAARMIEAVDVLAIPHAVSDAAPHVTISVGVATLCPQPGQDPDLLLKAADRALYAAKQAGRHRCMVSWG